MPEKRRRNNKNKRKNKNNRSEISNTAGKETKQIDNNDAPSNQNESPLVGNKGETSQENIIEFVVTPPSQISPIETQNVPDPVSSTDAQVLIYTNNNNKSEKSQSLNEPDFNLISEQTLDIDYQITTAYVVEPPEQTSKSKPKISSTIKSKSLDSDDVPKIVEITEDAAEQCEEENILSIIDSSNITVSIVEPVVEWEETDELHPCEEILPKNVATGTLSITTIPLDVAQCEQTKSLTPQDEITLRNYLKTLDLSTSPENLNSVEIKTEIEQIINHEIKHRLRKKATTEEFLMPRLGPSRILDVIDEEASGESSQNSRRQSYLSDKKSDSESVDDEVFEDKNACKQRFSTKALGSLRDATFGRLVPQKCVLVGAKIKEPEVCEARGDWTMTTVEKMTGAEVVYLTDSSSSTSSLHEIGEDKDDNDGIESDASIRMTTPVIEVTDTENLLKNSFISNIDKPQITSNVDKTTENGNIEHKVTIDYEKDNVNKSKDFTEPSHEIVVLSTDNIKTNLYVKNINDFDKHNQNKSNDETIKNSCLSDNSEMTKSLTTKSKNEYDLEIKVIKCELNDAINNLIKEVTSDSETVNEHLKDTFTRQDSSSSICSSQCTAKYNPTSSSLNDVSNLQPEEISENIQQNTDHSHNDNKEHKLIFNTSHVKDVLESVTGTHNKNKTIENSEQPLSLKDICLKRVASFPFGDKILEELASVSENLQKLSVEASENSKKSKYLYSVGSEHTEKLVSLMQTKKQIPPPVTPRNSSLKISQDDELRTNVNNKNDNTYVCMSPSQNMLLEITKTALSKDESDEFIYKRKYVSDNCGENRHKDVKNIDMSLPGPFKSQTGSRLLALICDPSIIANVNSSNKQYNNNIQQTQKRLVDSDLKPLINKEKMSAMRDFSNLFKPIPPPRSRKISSSIYESEESSDLTDNALRSVKREQKKFHFSTGNLNKEIEDDVSTIQNRHRFYADVHNQSYDYNVPRRPSLPKDLCDQQMEYIRQKEKEVEAEILRLQERQNSFIQRRGPRAPLISEKEIINENIKDPDNYFITQKRNVTIKSSAPEKRPNERNKMSSLFSSSQEELQREKMYSEYVSRMAEREERKQHKVIKITNAPVSSKLISKSMSALDVFDSKVNNRIEEEFISKARKRWEKLGIMDPETGDESDLNKSVYTEPKVIEHKINVIEDGEEKDIQNLPSHLQDFVRFTTKDKQSTNSGESNHGPASPHVVIWCAVIIIVLAIGKYIMRLFRNN